MTTDYLTTEEKLVMANSRAEPKKAKSSKLRKDLIEAMEVFDELRIEKMLVIQKDEEIQSAMLKLNFECEKAIAEFLSSKDLLNYHF